MTLLRPQTQTLSADTVLLYLLFFLLYFFFVVSSFALSVQEWFRMINLCTVSLTHKELAVELEVDVSLSGGFLH